MPCYNRIILNFIKDVSKMKVLFIFLFCAIVIGWSFWNGALYSSLCIHLKKGEEKVPFYLKWRELLGGLTTSKKVGLCIGFTLLTVMAFFSWCKHEDPFTFPKLKALILRKSKTFFAHFKRFSP